MDTWKNGIKKTFDDIAYENFKEAEIKCLYDPTDESYNDAKNKLEICKNREIDIKTY